MYIHYMNIKKALMEIEGFGEKSSKATKCY